MQCPRRSRGAAASAAAPANARSLDGTTRYTRRRCAQRCKSPYRQSYCRAWYSDPHAALPFALLRAAHGTERPALSTLPGRSRRRTFPPCGDRCRNAGRQCGHKGAWRSWLVVTSTTARVAADLWVRVAPAATSTWATWMHRMSALHLKVQIRPGTDEREDRNDLGSKVFPAEPDR